MDYGCKNGLWHWFTSSWAALVTHKGPHCFSASHRIQGSSWYGSILPIQSSHHLRSKMHTAFQFAASSRTSIKTETCIFGAGILFCCFFKWSFISSLLYFLTCIICLCFHIMCFLWFLVVFKYVVCKAPRGLCYIGRYNKSVIIIIIIISRVINTLQNLKMQTGQLFLFITMNRS